MVVCVGVTVRTGPCKNLGGPYKVLVRTLFSITGSLWEPCLFTCSSVCLCILHDQIGACLYAAM